MASSALPPERISVKRRRQDEPVDTLVLEQEQLVLQDDSENGNNRRRYQDPSYSGVSLGGGGGGSAPDKKRRFTDFIFQRLKRSDRNIVVGGGALGNAATATDKTINIVDNDNNSRDDEKSSVQQERYRSFGLPIVRATNPGDENRDFEKLRLSMTTGPKEEVVQLNTTVAAAAAAAATTDIGTTGDFTIREDDEDKNANTATGTATRGTSDTFQQPSKKSNIQVGNESGSGSGSASSYLLDKIKSARRFHLTRDLSATSPLGPNSSGGIRRRKQNLHLRPPLATFIERQQTHRNKVQGQDIYSDSLGSEKTRPIDRIVHFRSDKENAPAIPTQSQTGDDESAATTTTTTISTLDSTADDVKRTPLKTFRKPISTTKRHGQSMYDDPSTWDFESDQLADELAALALELDPDGANTETESLPAVNAEDAQQEPNATSAEVVMLDPGMGGDEDEDNAENDDGDYVYETYIRVQHVENPELPSDLFDGDVGVLVIDEEDHDLWGKYTQEHDDEDDWDDEDEDSNAEENPRNDYPEDEVSSDDERGTNVYKYRHDHSDDEEGDYGRD